MKTKKNHRASILKKSAAFMALLLAADISCRPKSDCSISVPAPKDSPLPLHTAAQEGNLKGLREMKDLAAGINLANAWGWTPLFFAVINGHDETVEFLLKSGACVNVKSPRGGHTPLHYAASYGYGGIAELLIRGGADINARDSYDNTPLHLAVTGNHLETATLMVRRGAGLNGKNNRGSTPLHISVWEKNREITALLLKSGADTGAKDLGDKTPRDLALLRGDDSVIEMFGEKKPEKARENKTP